jgi:outer membrane protein TolC
MKRISAIFSLAVSITAAVAQTNLPMVWDTNAVVPPPTNVVPGLNTNETRALTLEDCIAEALKHNFDVQVERYAPEISLYDLRGAYGGYDPTLSVSGTHNYNVRPGGLSSDLIPLPATTSKSDSFNGGIVGALPTGLQYDFTGRVTDTTTAENSGGNIGVSLTQPLLRNFWVDGTRLSISVAKNRLKYSEQALRQQFITTVTAVENAYYELIYAREFVQVQQQAMELAGKQLGDDRQRVQIQVLAERGGTIEQDEAQEAQSRANLIGAQFSLAKAQNTLKNLITDSYSQWHDIDVEPVATLAATRQLFDVQDSWNKGLRQRPDLKQAKLDVEQQGFQLKYSFNQIFPELDLVGSYGFNGQGNEFHDVFGQINEGNAPFYSYGAQLSIPLSNVKARNSYKANKATGEQILLRLKQLEQNVMVAIDNAVKQAQSSYESVDATRQARTYAEVALNAEQGKYSAGKSTTFIVLQLQNNLTSARSQEIRALADYNEALVNLALQEGDTLERRKIDLKEK